MSSNFCPNCGNGVKPGAKFCEKCGHSLEPAKQDTSQVSSGPPLNQQQPPQGYQQPPPQQQYGQPPQQYGQPPQYAQPGRFSGMWQKPPDYIRPPNYVFTESMSERIIGTMRLDVHVVEEIEERAELQEEAQKLLIFSLGIITIFNILSVFTLTDTYTVSNDVGAVLDIILSRFVGGFVYIYLVASVGKWIGGRETNVDMDEILRVLSYAYFAMAIYEVLSLLADTSGNNAFSLLVSLYFLYVLIIFVFVIRRALDKGYFTAIIVIVIAVIGTGLYQIVVAEILNSIFDGTYELVDP